MQINNKSINRFLRLGDSASMAVTSGSFEYVAPIGRVTKIEEIIFNICDGSIVADKFGGAAPLSTGVSLDHVNAANDSLNDLLDGENLKSNFSLARLGKLEVLAGNTNDCLTVRYKLQKPVVLQSGEKIRAVVSDSLTELTDFNISVKGYTFDADI